jgi:hypothetical protein
VQDDGAVLLSLGDADGQARANLRVGLDGDAGIEVDEGEGA